MSNISNTSIENNVTYDHSTVSKILGIQESTLRKYCSLMQKHHYKFQKNSVGHRIFFKKDIEILKQIINLKNSSSFTLDQAIKNILKSDINNTNNTLSNIDNNQT